MGARACRFFARFNRLEFSAPLVEASSGYPELLGQLIDAFAALHPLYGCALKLPGISLSSLHWCFLSRRVCPSRLCQFKGSFHFATDSLMQPGYFDAMPQEPKSRTSPNPGSASPRATATGIPAALVSYRSIRYLQMSGRTLCR
jgi:hypothetical protein